MSDAADSAFEAWWGERPQIGSIKGAFLAGYHSRDAEVAALLARLGALRTCPACGVLYDRANGGMCPCYRERMTVQKPIPCSERRPEYGVPVVCFHPGFRAGEGWTVQRPEEDESFTHWLPLPDPIPTESAPPTGYQTETLDCGCTVKRGWRCPVHGQP